MLIKTLYRMTVRIGALITLLAIAIDPFTQQLIQLEQIMIYTPNTAVVIPRAQRYSQGNEYVVSLSGAQSES